MSRILVVTETGLFALLNLNTTFFGFSRKNVAAAIKMLADADMNATVICAFIIHILTLSIKRSQKSAKNLFSTFRGQRVKVIAMQMIPKPQKPSETGNIQ